MRIIIQDVRHLKLKQDFLWVSTATLVTVIIWVAFAIYSAFQHSTVDSEVDRLLKPLNPSLDQATIQTLNNRFTPPETFTIFVVGAGGQPVPMGSTLPTTAPAATRSAAYPTPTPTGQP